MNTQETAQTPRVKSRTPPTIAEKNTPEPTKRITAVPRNRFGAELNKQSERIDPEERESDPIGAYSSGDREKGVIPTEKESMFVSCFTFEPSADQKHIRKSLLDSIQMGVGDFQPTVSWGQISQY